MKTNNFLNIENKKGNLKLNDTVHKGSADQLIKELESLYGVEAVASNMTIGDIVCCVENALESVEVEINTPGGSVMEGQRIYNALKGMSSRGVHITTTVNGLAASMGSVILMAGDERKMTHGSRIMIHEASTIAQGNAQQLRTQSELLESVSSEIADIYAEKANGSADEIRELMKNETWMSAGEAETAGFIDTIIKDGIEPDAEPETSNELKSPLFQTPNNNTPEMTNPFTPDAKLIAKLETVEAENTEHAKKIASYEDVMKNDAQSILTLKTEKDELSAKLETENADLSAKLEAAETEKTKLASETEAEKADLTAKLEESEGKQTDFDDKVEAAASAKVASLGHPEPIKADSSDGGNPAEMPRAEFNKLTPAEKSKFSVNGGRIK